MVLLSHQHCKTPGLTRPEERMAKIGIVSKYNGPDQLMRVGFFSVCGEKQDGDEKEIDVVRTQVYHLPPEPWFQLMWMKGTPIPPSIYEDFQKHTVALGGKRSKRRVFGANASNPFLVKI